MSCKKKKEEKNTKYKPISLMNINYFSKESANWGDIRENGKEYL